MTDAFAADCRSISHSNQYFKRVYHQIVTSKVLLIEILRSRKDAYRISTSHIYCRLLGLHYTMVEEKENRFLCDKEQRKLPVKACPEGLQQHSSSLYISVVLEVIWLSSSSSTTHVNRNLSA